MYIQPEYNTGFTLIELMVTIAIAGILIGVAIPNFTSIIISNRLTTSANELVTALSLARSEAVKRGINVTVRRKGGTSTQWESGWDIFVDVNGNNVNDGTDTLLRSYDALPNGYTLRTGNSRYKDYAAYLPSGLGVSGNDTFRLCNGTDKATSRAIIINFIGRARVSTGTASCP